MNGAYVGPETDREFAERAVRAGAGSVCRTIAFPARFTPEHVIGLLDKIDQLEAIDRRRRDTIAGARDSSTVYQHDGVVTMSGASALEVGAELTHLRNRVAELEAAHVPLPRITPWTDA